MKIPEDVDNRGRMAIRSLPTLVVLVEERKRVSLQNREGCCRGSHVNRQEYEMFKVARHPEAILSSMLLPAFELWPEEGALSGRLLAGYGELELNLASIVGHALCDMPKVRGPSFNAEARRRASI